MNKLRNGVDFGFADGFMPDGTPVYIQTRPGESPSSLQLQIYAQLTGAKLNESILYPRMTILPWNQESVEPALSKLVEERIKLLKGEV